MHHAKNQDAALSSNRARRSWSNVFHTLAIDRCCAWHCFILKITGHGPRQHWKLIFICSLVRRASREQTRRTCMPPRTMDFVRRLVDLQRPKRSRRLLYGVPQPRAPEISNIRVEGGSFLSNILFTDIRVHFRYTESYVDRTLHSFRQLSMRAEVFICS